MDSELWYCLWVASGNQSGGRRCASASLPASGTSARSQIAAPGAAWEQEAGGAMRSELDGWDKAHSPIVSGRKLRMRDVSIGRRPPIVFPRIAVECQMARVGSGQLPACRPVPSHSGCPGQWSANRAQQAPPIIRTNGRSSPVAGQRRVASASISGVGKTKRIPAVSASFGSVNA